MGLEIFNPVERNTEISAKCAGHAATFAWLYDKSVKIRRITFDSIVAAPDDLTSLEMALGQFEDDILVDLKCGSGGATFRIIESASAANSRAKVVRADFFNGRVRIVMPYRPR